MDTEWMAVGNCAHQSPAYWFFPSDGVGVEVARRICASCPVKEACLEYALPNGIDHGVGAGRPSVNGAGSPAAGAWSAPRPPAGADVPRELGERLHERLGGTADLPQ